MPAHLIAKEGPLRGLILNLEEGTEWIIGRDSDAADFVLEDTTVSRKHARLAKTADGIYLKNLSRVNPALVNDQEPEDQVLLVEGDRIQIGNTLFLFSEEEVPNLGEGPAPKRGRKKKTPKEDAGYEDIFSGLEDSSSREETQRGEADTEPRENPEEEPEEEPEDAGDEMPPRPSAEMEKSEPTAYDTIFEDAEEDEELPFNLMSPTPLLLKVIAGPNAGAEIGVEKGRTYTIGKDANTCDIVFQDLSVSRNHATLSVSAEGVIELEDLGSKNGTVVNGAVITEKQIVTPQDLIAMGTTVFLIIDREAQQETIYSPITTSHEEEKAQEPEPEQIPEIEPEPEKDWKLEPIPTKHLVAGVSFLAVFLIVFLSFFSLFKSKGIEVSHKEPVSHIKEAVEKFPDVQFSFNPGSGKLFLVGHVLTSVEDQELRFRIEQIPFVQSVENNVIIDDGVAKAMNDVLSTNEMWRGVAIRATEPGKFIAAGYLQTNEQMTQFSEYLTANFPYTDRLDNQVAVVDNLYDQLQGMLISHGFGAVTLQLTNGEVILSGRYSEKMHTEYRHLLKQIQGIAGVAMVKDFAVPTSPNQAAIDLTKDFQVGGSSTYDGRGYSAILNGRIYTLGDSVDGLTITAIESNTILLEKDGIKYKIDYTR